MNQSLITQTIISQLPKDYAPESLEMYTELFNAINALSPIKSFILGLDTNNHDDGDIHSNLTIITFDDLPKSSTRNQIIDTVQNITDENPEYKFLVSEDILILSFDF